MRLTSQPTGTLIAKTKLNEQALVSYHLQRRTVLLADEVLNDIRLSSVEEAISKQIKPYFDLRIDLVNWVLNDKPELYEELGTPKEQIVRNFQLAPASKLAAVMAEALVIMSKVFSSLQSGAFDDVADAGEKNLKPTYESFEVIAQHPDPKFKYLKKFIDESVKFDLVFMITELLFTEKAPPFSTAKTDELIEFITTTIIRFGAYSIFTGFWTPDPSDDSPFLNRIQILAAKLHLDHYPGKAVDSDTLRQLLTT